MSGAVDKRDWASLRLHFIGIGGAGMSGLALVCKELGAAVGGSDRADSSYMHRLREAGLEPSTGHDAANLPEDAVVVVSTAIGDDNPELALARERGQEVIHRGELLAELCAEKRLIAVAGTHGKTTTTAMLVWALRGIGADPAFFVGGEVPGLGPAGEPTNAGWGAGEWVVAEADESDASFLALRPEVATITNIEMDHHSRWGSVSELSGAFRDFAAAATGLALPAPGSLPGAPPEPSGQEGQGPAGGDRPTEVLFREASADEASTGRKLIGFDAEQPGPPRLDLRVWGRHNLFNARAALAAIELAGMDSAAAAEALRDFPGVGRRLEHKGSCSGADIYDDYAHHPTEVRAALEALRERDPTRLVVVFQPHLYSRTKALAEEFGAALALADEAVVLDVYPAREDPVGELAGVSGKLVADAASERMGGRPVCWTPGFEEALGAVRRRLSSGEALVTIGAGDVFKLAEALAAEAPEGGA
jgi:UDP-N-acetylmuramate--alanine ligase